MAVLNFEAYQLEYLQRGEGYYDDNGDYQPSEDRWVYVGRCNAVPAGHNNVISTPDGKEILFSFTIILHNAMAREFVYGEKIRLTTIQDMEIRELSVKGFSRYQYQCKIYA